MLERVFILFDCGLEAAAAEAEGAVDRRLDRRSVSQWKGRPASATAADRTDDTATSLFACLQQYCTSGSNLYHSSSVETVG